MIWGIGFTSTYFEEEGHHCNKKQHPASHLLVLSPTSKAAAVSAKCFVAGDSCMASIWEGPRSVPYRVETTTIVAVLDPSYYVSVLLREEPGPSTFKVAFEVTWRNDVRKGQSGDDGVVDEEKHDCHHGQPRKGTLGPTTTSIRATTEGLSSS